MLAMVALSVTAAAQDQRIHTTVDDVLVSFPDVQPQMVNNRVMVPIRGVFEHMNAKVVWNARSRTATANRGATDVVLTIGSNHALVNGRRVMLDTPATYRAGRTMVPLRFLSESLQAIVVWVADTRTVEIVTMSANQQRPARMADSNMRIDADTVVPIRLNQPLSSNGSDVGDRFTATIDTNDGSYDRGLPAATVFEGHVNVARAKTGNTPGVLGLAFDHARFPDGQRYAIHDSTIGLDSKSVEERNGRLIARPGARNDNLTYVGFGAGAGALVALVTKGNVLTTTLIGGALGYLYGEIKKDPSKARDVSLAKGTRSGIRLTQAFSFRSPNDN
jgi:hypothetical protein